MLAKLERLIGEIGDLNSKLILLVGPSHSGKTQLLRQLGAKLNIEPLNVGLELGRRLAATCSLAPRMTGPRHSLSVTSTFTSSNPSTGRSSAMPTWRMRCSSV